MAAAVVILENAVPFAEDEVAGDEDAASLVPLGEGGEEHLHLVSALLDVADIVEDDRVVAVEESELFLEPQVALCGEETLHERERRREEDAVPALDELVADGAHEVRLAAPGKAEDEDEPMTGRPSSASSST